MTSTKTSRRGTTSRSRSCSSSVGDRKRDIPTVFPRPTWKWTWRSGSRQYGNVTTLLDWNGADLGSTRNLVVPSEFLHYFASRHPSRVGQSIDLVLRREKQRVYIGYTLGEDVIWLFYWTNGTAPQPIKTYLQKGE